MKRKKRELPEPRVIPAEYVGRWVAWDSGDTRIIASGATLQECRSNASAAGEPHPVYEFIPVIREFFERRSVDSPDTPRRQIFDGQPISGWCNHCNGTMPARFAVRDCPVDDPNTVVPDIVVVVCDICDRTIGVPPQSLPDVYRWRRRILDEAGVPADDVHRRRMYLKLWMTPQQVEELKAEREAVRRMRRDDSFERMSDAKRRALEASGYKVGDAADFLGLTPEERAEVERRLEEIRRPPDCAGESQSDKMVGHGEENDQK